MRTDGVVINVDDVSLSLSLYNYLIKFIHHAALRDVYRNPIPFRNDPVDMALLFKSYLSSFPRNKL